MRILHVWNTAMVGHTLAKYQRDLGHEVTLIDRVATSKKRLIVAGLEDPFYEIVISNRELVRQLETRSRESDIVHIHADDLMLQRLRKLHPKKPIVLTYHGDDIRNRWKTKEQRYRQADAVTVATPDLLEGAPEEVIHVPNPVDLGLFQRDADFFSDTALFVWVSDAHLVHDRALRDAERLQLSMRVQKRSRWIFPYLVYPRFLELFEYYIDVKQSSGEIIPSMSLTALQALSLGTKVVFMGDIYDRLPSSHEPRSVARKWIGIYRSLL